ncbi:Uu.00g123630.m01.CDS01 [Anthostomella pinea]|uniref:Uu.00g123630.m01.CDS01 n=1 Tax=Anthostomella pinea TaxID=933095 RepID=A0AAI8VHC0_9PEZI|nr:Uu.00g123630.m01.CDS01 [Anthostomella pinea]
MNEPVPRGSCAAAPTVLTGDDSQEPESAMLAGSAHGDDRDDGATRTCLGAIAASDVALMATGEKSDVVIKLLRYCIDGGIAQGEGNSIFLQFSQHPEWHIHHLATKKASIAFVPSHECGDEKTVQVDETKAGHQETVDNTIRDRDGHTLRLSTGSRGRATYKFDRVFDRSATDYEVLQNLQPLLRDVARAAAVVIFTYDPVIQAATLGVENLQVGQEAAARLDYEKKAHEMMKTGNDRCLCPLLDEAIAVVPFQPMLSSPNK